MGRVPPPSVQLSRLLRLLSVLPTAVPAERRSVICTTLAHARTIALLLRAWSVDPAQLDHCVHEQTLRLGVMSLSSCSAGQLELQRVLPSPLGLAGRRGLWLRFRAACKDLGVSPEAQLRSTADQNGVDADALRCVLLTFRLVRGAVDGGCSTLQRAFAGLDHAGDTEAADLQAAQTSNPRMDTCRPVPERLCG